MPLFSGLPSSLGLVSRCWPQLDHAKVYERTVEAAFPFRRGRKIGIAAMLKETRACGKNFIERQTSPLQRDGAK
jgi:hypothetical protein